MVAGLVQAAARHVGASIAPRAAQQVELDGDVLDGEGAAAVQPDLGTQRAVDGHMPRPCPHGRQRSKCKECGGSGICEHGRVRYSCKDCGGSGICEHGRHRSQCKECGGGSICEHGRRRSQCKDCGGASICEHGRRRCYCKECGGGGLCEHGRRRYGCKECGGSSQGFVVLDAVAVEVDEDAEPEEWIPMQSHIAVAAEPRGGKRKR